MKLGLCSGLRSGIRIIGPALAVLFLGAWIGGGIPEKPADLILPPIPDECEAECEDCEDNGIPGHTWTNWGGEGWEPSESESGHTCEHAASCNGSTHKRCDPAEEEDLESLSLTLAGLDGEGLKSLISRNPTRLLWNPERTSVQLLGCGDKITLSVVVDETQAFFLESDD